MNFLKVLIVVLIATVVWATPPTSHNDSVLKKIQLPDSVKVDTTKYMRISVKIDFVKGTSATITVFANNDSVTCVGYAGSKIFNYVFTEKDLVK